MDKEGITNYEQLLSGKKCERLEAAITHGLAEAITMRARELAGGDPDSRNFRSAAARDLLARGILAWREQA